MSELRQVAVLFARKDSIYKTMLGCDVWDEDRDALLTGTARIAKEWNDKQGKP